jgi:hypothetical protein
MVHRVVLFFVLLLGCGNKGVGYVDARAVSSDGSVAEDGTVGASDAGDNDGDSSSNHDAAVGVTCGTSICTAAHECCVSTLGAHKCVVPGTCSDAAFACAAPTDCDGDDACCSFVTGQGSAAGAANVCAPESECHNGEGLNQICHSDQDCAFLPHSQKCCDAMWTWQKICRAHCGNN